MQNISLFKFRRPVVALTIMIVALVVAACGGGDEAPDLVIPTPVVVATVPAPPAPTLDTTAAPTASRMPIITVTLPPAPTVAPPLPTTTAVPQAPTVPPTVAPTAVAPTATVSGTTPGESGYRVAFVAANDTLNVRRQPNANAAVVTRLPAAASGIQVIGEGETVRGSSLWLPVETSAGDGWVNSRFLTEFVSHETFCADPAVTGLLNQFETAVAAEDGKALLELVHPDRGLRLRRNWWNEEVIVEGNDIQTLFRAQKKYDWGTEDGSGEPIRGSFSEVMMPFLARDLLGATEWRCDEGQFGGTAGATVLPEGYDAVRYFSAHRPAPAEQELDWGTWLIGIERWEGRYYISYLVHYRWEI